MISSNRYLLFYAILGIGLAISWSMVGKRAKLKPDAGLYIMSTEEVCRPYQRPCAAYAGNFALVLGPDGDVLRLQTTQSMPQAQLEFAQLNDETIKGEIPEVRQLSANAWEIRPLRRLGRLRVNVLIPGQQWLAEFPLDQ